MKLMLVRCLFDGTVYEHVSGSGDCCPVCGRCTEYDIIDDDYGLIVCAMF